MVDVTSHGCGVAVPVTAAKTHAGPSPLPWTSSERVRTGTRNLPAEALLEGSVPNAGLLRVDVARACLRGGFDHRITSDGPAVLRLSDGRSLSLVKGLNTGRLRVV